MSAARTILTVAAAVVVLPVAMRARESGSASASLLTLPAMSAPERDPRATMADVRAYFDGMRGANALQCEIALSSFNSWSSSRAPDRDSVAWNVAMVVHRRIASEQIIPDVVAALRSGDECVSRLAARMLGRSRLAGAKSALLAALGDESAQVRRLGAIGIGFSEDSTANGRLVSALSDRDERVRAAAAWALGAVNEH